MKKNKINTGSKDALSKDLGAVMNAFETGIESLMDTITGSFEVTKQDSEAITSLFKSSRAEAEAIFSVFSSIVKLFGGSSGGGLFDALLGFIPGGELIGSIFAGSQSGSGAMYPQSSGSNPAPVVIVNTQLEKAGIYRIYREGKIMSEMRPGV